MKRLNKKIFVRFLIHFVLNEIKIIDELIVEKLIIEDKIPLKDFLEIFDKFDILENELLEIEETYYTKIIS